MGFSIFPNTYAEVILLRLCEININAFLTAVNKCQWCLVIVEVVTTCKKTLHLVFLVFSSTEFFTHN